MKTSLPNYASSKKRIWKRERRETALPAGSCRVEFLLKRFRKKRGKKKISEKRKGEGKEKGEGGKRHLAVSTPVSLERRKGRGGREKRKSWEKGGEEEREKKKEKERGEGKNPGFPDCT